mmetsp:Transcript_23852/g.51595  ORF Transcript_23852/g.51595 Transcript_23852/m.51595 type:complete len:209 (-) Transcript_23852:610-1236(-)
MALLRWDPRRKNNAIARANSSSSSRKPFSITRTKQHRFGRNANPPVVPRAKSRRRPPRFSWKMAPPPPRLLLLLEPRAPTPPTPPPSPPPPPPTARTPTPPRTPSTPIEPPSANPSAASTNPTAKSSSPNGRRTSADTCSPSSRDVLCPTTTATARPTPSGEGCSSRTVLLLRLPMAIIEIADDDRWIPTRTAVRRRRALALPPRGVS